MSMRTRMARGFGGVGLLVLFLACGGSSGEAEAVDEIDAGPDSGLRAGPDGGLEVGDFVLENAFARFFVRGGLEPAFWGPFGGNLIDADVPRAEGDLGGDLLGELIPIVSNGILLRAFRPARRGTVGRRAAGPAPGRPRGVGSPRA